MKDNKKIAIIGASYLQEPLILKAKSMGIETHVFAWKADDVGEKCADYFYDISIVEKEVILEKCKEIGIHGICSIASDLASVTVNYVAHNMGLIGNSLESTLMSTNKNEMRKCFFKNNIPSPKSILVDWVEDLQGKDFSYPIIVKPLDRSGSRGITKLDRSDGLEEAIENAKQVGFIKKALVEEFATGHEYSVEGISWEGEHKILAVTKKFTTQAPHFIETGHIQQADISDELYARVVKVICEALDALHIRYGASHSEIKINENGDIKIIEIGGRMGGDFIGSDLVPMSTGYDYVKAVIQVSMGVKPDMEYATKPDGSGKVAAVKFIFNKNDICTYEGVLRDKPELIVRSDINYDLSGEVTDSSTRFGYFLMSGQNVSDVKGFFE